MRRRNWLVAALVLAAALLGAGITWASIPGPDGVIHGCYKTSNPAQGSLLVVDSSASCPNGFTALNWNQAGPQGPAGTNGISGYEFIREEFRQPDDVPWPTGVFHEFDVACSAGKDVLGGGIDASNDGSATGASIVSSYPVQRGGSSPAGWHVGVTPDVPLSYVAVFAICANMN